MRHPLADCSVRSPLVCSGPVLDIETTAFGIALHRAVENLDYSQVKSLLEQHADPNEYRLDEHGALAYAPLTTLALTPIKSGKRGVHEKLVQLGEARSQRGAVQLGNF